MDEQVLRKILQALPDEGLRELNTMLDGDFEEKDIRDLLDKYGVNIATVLFGKEEA